KPNSSAHTIEYKFASRLNPLEKFARLDLAFFSLRAYKPAPFIEIALIALAGFRARNRGTAGVQLVRGRGVSPLRTFGRAAPVAGWHGEESGYVTERPYEKRRELVRPGGGLSGRPGVHIQRQLRQHRSAQTRRPGSGTGNGRGRPAGIASRCLGGCLFASGRT